MFWVTSAVLLATALSFALDRAFRFNLPTRLGLLAIAVVAVLVVVARRLVRPLLLPLEPLDLAELLDRRSRGVGQKISNVLQLPELLLDEHFASPSMVRAAVIECARSLDEVDLTGTLNVRRRRGLALGLLALIAAAGALALAWPETASLWARRWLAGSTIRWPQSTYLSVPGLEDDSRLLVPRGEMSLVHIDARPEFAADGDHWTLSGRGEPLVVESAGRPTSQPPEQVALDYRMPDGSKRRGNATQFGEASFRYELPPLAEPVELYLSGGDDWLGPITIEPIDRPSVSLLELTSRRPGSDADETVRVGDANAQLLFLPETKLRLRLVASQPLASAEVVDKGAPMAGWQRVDDRTYTLDWTMSQSLALEFRLTGQRGALGSKPTFLAIGLLKDREPRVTIRSSGVSRRVTPVARIPLAIRANDDFGVASLALEWERTATRDEKQSVETKRFDIEEPAPPEAALERELNRDHEISLGQQGLAPGNTLKLRGTATDACALGTQIGHSRWLSFQIVASDELFYEILMRQREQRAKFTVALESAKAQSTALAEAAKSEDILGVSRAEQVIARQVWQVAGVLDASLVEMTLNDLGNPQARDNMQTAIITPLRNLHGDLLQRLRAAVDALAAPGALSEEKRTEVIALADQSVETMQAILAQMSLWESFIDVVNQLKQIIDRQNLLLKSTEEVEKKRTEDLFDP